MVGAADDLHLLLAPDPGADVAELRGLLGAHGAVFKQAQRADAETIKSLLYRYKRRQAGAGADRLWFYYAGHGVAPPAGSPEDGPLVVPADVTDLARYVEDDRIALEQFRQKMQVAPPREQLRRRCVP